MSIALTILFIAFALFLVLGFPVGYALAISSFIYLVYEGIPLTTIVTRMAGSLNSFTIMAVPFFILAGQLMNHCGLTERLVRFTRVLVGHFRGGLAQVNIVASIIFAGMSGSAVADAGGLGSVLIPAMEQDGYDTDLAAAVTAASCTIGPIIPPSIPMVLYGVIAEVSIGRLFLGGFIPGLLMGLTMMLLVRFEHHRRDLPVHSRASFKDFKEHSGAAIIALLMPIIIIGGIISGYFTPTEAAVIATLYALFIGIAVLRTMNIPALIKVFIDGMLISGGILFIVAAAGIFGWILSREGITWQMMGIIQSWDLSPIMLLLFLNVLLLLIGCFIEPLSALVILTPVLHPLIISVGINPIHFGVIMVMNLMIGLVTPPMGLALYVVTDISDVRFEKVVQSILPFYIPLIITLLLVTLFPQLVLFLPNLIF